MKIRTYFFLAFVFFLVFLYRGGTLWAQPTASLHDEFSIQSISSLDDLSTMLGVTDMLKIPVSGENVSLTLTLHIYRTPEPLLVDEVKERVVEPVEKRPVATMYLRSDTGKPYILFVVQKLLLHGEEEIILHWGLGEEEDGSRKLSHSRVVLQVQELKDPSYSWVHGLFTPKAPQWDTPFPIYVFRGKKGENGSVSFPTYGQDSIDVQAQLHDVLVVVIFQVS